jgi:hypothetical protein
LKCISRTRCARVSRRCRPKYSEAMADRYATRFATEVAAELRDLGRSTSP